MKVFNLTVNNKFLSHLKEMNIFQTRSGMRQGTQYSYINRFKKKQILQFERHTIIEEFSTFAHGNILYSAGSFSSLASALPVGSRTGRYTSLAAGLTRIGYRHPIESVCMNSAAFNFSRENIASYFDQYEASFGAVNKVSVPQPQPQYRPINIGHDVWIGANVTILGGINIGNGAVIASNSIVTKNVEPFSIVAGSPATHKKYRFPLEIVQELEAIQWWEYELGDLYREELNFADPADFINKFNLTKNNIKRLSVRKFSPYVYKHYGVTDQNLIFDCHNNFLCFDLQNRTVIATKLRIKNFIPIFLKKIGNSLFLYAQGIGLINISSELQYSVVASHKDIHYKITFKDEIEFSIKIKGLFLLSKVDNKFYLQKKPTGSEIFHYL